MNQYQRKSIENLVNDIWYSIDRTYVSNEEQQNRLALVLRGIDYAMDRLGYCIAYDLHTGSRKLVSYKEKGV